MTHTSLSDHPLSDRHVDDSELHPLLWLYRKAATEQPPESLDALMQAAYRRGLKKQKALAEMTAPPVSEPPVSEPPVSESMLSEPPAPVITFLPPLPKGRQTPSLSFRPSVWYVPVGLAAGLILWMWMPFAITPLPSEQQVIAIWTDIQALERSRGISRGETAPSDPTPPTVPQDPQRWLDTMSVLIMQGRLREAETLLTAFKYRYPHYSVPQREDN